jgi:acid phosphatase (class A)
MTRTPLRSTLFIGGTALMLSLGAIAYAFDAPPGYGARVDWQRVLGSPPAAGSAADKADRAAFAKTAGGIGSTGWKAAEAQVYPSAPEVRAQLSCALGHSLSDKGTPVTLRLLSNQNVDLKVAVDAGKDFYRRNRPYVGANDSRTCDARTLGAIGGATGGALNYGWPSGHAAQGRLTALTLSAAEPGRKAALMQWGDELGANRLVCRVHWASDIAAGRRLGDAVFDKLQTVPAWRADLVAARAELARAPTPANCPA